MADYPAESTLPFGEDSVAEIISGTRIDRTTNGTAKAQNQYSSDKSVFKLKHTGIGSSAKSSLDSCYSTNRTSAFTFDWVDGNTYTVLFAHAPQYKYWKNSNYVDAIVTLVEQ